MSQESLLKSVCFHLVFHRQLRKGFFDRVLLPGIAFLLPEPNQDGTSLNAGLIPGLTNIKKLGDSLDDSFAYPCSSHFHQIKI